LPSVSADEESQSVKGEGKSKPKEVDIRESLGNVFDPDFSYEKEGEDREAEDELKS
jgi:hypothetical protein